MNTTKINEIINWVALRKKIREWVDTGVRIIPPVVLIIFCVEWTQTITPYASRDQFAHGALSGILWIATNGIIYLISITIATIPGALLAWFLMSRPKQTNNPTD